MKAGAPSATPSTDRGNNMLHNLIQFIADDQSKWDQTIRGGNLVL